MKKWGRGLVGLLVFFAILITFANWNTYAATSTNRVPITAYTLNGRVNTYQSVNGSYSGYVASGDRCTILELYDCGWIKVKYPVSQGYKTAYTKSEYFLLILTFWHQKLH